MCINKIISAVVFTLSFSSFVQSQHFDIVPYLMKVERGELDAIKSELNNLILKYPDDPNIFFLDAVVTNAGDDAASKFMRVVENYPNSKYADAAVYRLFNYYFTQDNKDLSKKYFDKLKNDYPESPYLKIAKTQYDILISSEVIERETVEPVIKKTTETSFIIQAGAFARRENALSLKSQLEKAGVFTEIKEKNVAGTIFSVVYAGKFSNREDAENFLQIVNSQFKLQGMIVKIGDEK